jgi:hypothetical protein
MNPKTKRYIKRTLKHIHRVQSNMAYILTNHADRLLLSEKDIRLMMYKVMVHDRSKFSEAQYDAYIELTEYYRQRKKLGNKEYDYPDEDTKEKVDLAVKNHYQVENHHPERNTPLTKHECIEVICDLQAMAQEFNEGTCRKYFTDVWSPRYSQKINSDNYATMCTVVCCFEEEML